MKAPSRESGRGAGGLGGLERAGRFFTSLAALALAMLLFAGAFPNPAVENGLPFLAWIAYAPVFWVISRWGFAGCALWGALYGYGAYSLFNYWLSVFHPLAGLIVGLLYMAYMAVLFPLLKAAERLFPRKGYILQLLLWVVFEYLRTLGFLGYSYGITGYSQWQVLPVIQIASVTGVWGVSALVLFPSVWLAWALRGEALIKGQGTGAPATCCRRPPSSALYQRLPPLAWAVCLAGALVYGALARVDYADAPKVNIALVQHNTDPWKGGITQYRENYRVLKRLSLEALAREPKPDLVAWSETAFVPRIYWHTTYRDDPESWELVKELLAFLAGEETPFVIGNDDARKELSEKGTWERVDYNGVMLFEGGVNTRLYRKLHLVPFTEYFPYGKQFPWVYDALVRADTHFWKKGEEAVVFTVPVKDGAFELKFSTPICFEDTFGYLSRDFTRNGAELILNLSNDAWSASLPAQNQHLSMAVFRAVENRRSMARAAASGQTCGIDPNGRVLAMAEPFTEAAITVELPVLSQTTLYTRFGDFFPFLCLGGACGMLTIKFISVILRKRRKGPGRAEAAV